MTPKQLQATRKRLNLTQMELSKQLEVNVRQVERWESGESPIKKVVELAIKFLENPPKTPPRKKRKTKKRVNKTR